MVTIPTIDQISGTTVMNKMRSLINNYIEFGTEVGTTVNYMKEVIDNLPHDITDVYNKETIDGMFETMYSTISADLGDYYTKVEINTNIYTKSEVNELIRTVGSFRVVVVDGLPEVGQDGIIYLVPRTTTTTNDYDEYIWAAQWELIGQISNVDLENYYTKTESDSRYYTKSDADSLLAGKVSGNGNIGSDSKPVKIVNGVATAVTSDLATTSQIPTKISGDVKQHVTYWRMDITGDNWVAGYNNTSNNVVVGWLRYQASGSTGTLKFLVGSGPYEETITVSDYEVHIMPIIIPPNTKWYYQSTCFMNGWATLYELKLA